MAPSLAAYLWLFSSYSRAAAVVIAALATVRMNDQETGEPAGWLISPDYPSLGSPWPAIMMLSEVKSTNPATCLVCDLVTGPVLLPSAALSWRSLSACPCLRAVCTFASQHREHPSRWTLPSTAILAS